MQSVALTDCGQVRQMNQDNIFICDQRIGPLPNLYIVADGMGGEKAGDVASAELVKRMCDHIENSKERPLIALNEAILHANKEIFSMAQTNKDFQGMGTTLVTATYISGELLVANVGDSRLYLLDHSKINQVTVDHSYVEEMVRLGKFSRDSKEYQEKKNIITRAVGASEVLEIDYFKLIPKKGNIALLCSDGLSNMVSDECILDIVNLSDSLEKAARELVKTANDNGGKDNISVILLSGMGEEK